MNPKVYAAEHSLRVHPVVKELAEVLTKKYLLLQFDNSRVINLTKLIL